jgi:hypothetical protein
VDQTEERKNGFRGGLADGSRSIGFVIPVFPELDQVHSLAMVLSTGMAVAASTSSIASAAATTITTSSTAAVRRDDAF